MKSLSSKKTKVTWLVLFTLFITLYISYESIDFSDGDTILFHNGNIITMEKDHQYPEAIYIEKGIIQSIGKYDVLKNKVLPSTKFIDLEGKTLMPGFIDSHTHPVISSFLYDMIDLSGFTHNSKELVWNHLTNKISEYNPDQWILLSLIHI